MNPLQFQPLRAATPLFAVGSPRPAPSLALHTPTAAGSCFHRLMKNSRIWTLALCGLFSSALNAQTLTDTFSGTTLNTSNWVASAFTIGSVTVNDGLTLTARGRITSAYGFTGPLTITGTVSFPVNHEYLSIMFRFSGAYDDPNYGAATDGIGVLIGPALSGVKFSVGDINGGYQPLTVGFSYSLNTPYNFKITDDGSNVTFYMNDMTTPLFTTTSAISSGNLVGFYSRENIGLSEISAIQITAVPEPATWGVIVGLGAFGLVILRRRFAAKSG